MPGIVTDSGRPAVSTMVVVVRPSGVVNTKRRLGPLNVVLNDGRPLMLVCSIQLSIFFRSPPSTETARSVFTVPVRPLGMRTVTDWGTGIMRPNRPSEARTTVSRLPSGDAIDSIAFELSVIIVRRPFGPNFVRRCEPSGRRVVP
jgi:hypothetical protein